MEIACRIGPMTLPVVARGKASRASRNNSIVPVRNCADLGAASRWRAHELAQHQRSSITIEDRVGSLTQPITGRPFALSICHVMVGRVRLRATWLIRVSRTKSALATAFILAPPRGSLWAVVMAPFFVRLGYQAVYYVTPKKSVFIRMEARPLDPAASAGDAAPSSSRLTPTAAKPAGRCNQIVSRCVARPGLASKAGRAKGNGH